MLKRLIMNMKITKRNVIFIYSLSLILVIPTVIYSIIQDEYRIIPIILILVLMGTVGVIKIRNKRVEQDDH